MITVLRSVSMMAAALTMGLSAGLFATFFYSVMPGLRVVGDGTFVEAMRKINIQMLNGWFALCFGGALVFTLAAALLQLGAGGSAIWWTVAGLVLYVIVLIITFGVNVPLNDALEASGGTNVAAAREQFEAAWVRWNVARTALSAGAFGCVAWALIVHGRLTA
ncbi:DUF1772 domain-containing protein [Streptosporangiaceae bacterium NEAU-GS5]|nr:DUF1772 domain-containing protein [Streptosporangiaceae bacterium NEAU-GS5]